MSRKGVNSIRQKNHSIESENSSASFVDWNFTNLWGVFSRGAEKASRREISVMPWCA